MKIKYFKIKPSHTNATTIVSPAQYRLPKIWVFSYLTPNQINPVNAVENVRLQNFWVKILLIGFLLIFLITNNIIDNSINPAKM
ncbi:MAG: hypothetical protein KW804_02815 [Candidatus Doudnabacteria bacterium]|nr:hypothetical protein [Candidatus Doudnabacteria bacterium]